MDSTSIDALFPPTGGSSQSAPPLPASTTYTPVVTPGTMSYNSPQMPSQITSAPTHYIKHVLRTIVQYLAIFLAATILSLPSVQSLGLRHVPGSYTAGGVLSMTGAAVVGATIVVLGYIMQSVLTPILV